MVTQLEMDLKILDPLLTVIALGGLASLALIPFTGLYGFAGYLACYFLIGLVIWIYEGCRPRDLSDIVLWAAWVVLP